MNLRQQFLDKYRALDKEQRREIVLWYHEQPYTWNPIWVEVENTTVVGYNMLKQMAAEGTL